MKKILFGAIVASLSMLPGCASLTETPTYVPNYAKMQAVEAAAERFGTQVIWVNVPQKKVDNSKS